MATPLYEDTPLALIHTPKFKTGNTDAFTEEGSHMALSHNAFIRGFNSIYQQASRITASDRADFVGYCLAWHQCVEEHHHYEETAFFPALDKAIGKDGVMGHAVEEHAAFHGGMDRFRDYLKQEGANFDSYKLIGIMDAFSAALYSHLQSEPASIVALAKYHTPEKPIDILAMAQEAGKKSMTVGFVFNVLPVFLLNMETREFEDGMWHDVFPPFKGVVKSILNKGVPMWQSKRWRFTSCGPDGEIKHLAV